MTEEHKRKTAEMIAVMQAYVDGKPIEHTMSPGGLWCPLSEPAWNWTFADYRIATTPDSITWDHVSPEWKYMARDEDGDAYLFHEEPRLKGAFWGADCDNIRAECFSSYVRGTVDWKDSLVRRPS